MHSLSFSLTSHMYVYWYHTDCTRLSLWCYLFIIFCLGLYASNVADDGNYNSDDCRMCFVRITMVLGQDWYGDFDLNAQLQLCTGRTVNHRTALNNVCVCNIIRSDVFLYVSSIKLCTYVYVCTRMRLITFG